MNSITKVSYHDMVKDQSENFDTYFTDKIYRLKYLFIINIINCQWILTTDKSITDKYFY